jgi:hypothetical protein
MESVIERNNSCLLLLCGSHTYCIENFRRSEPTIKELAVSTIVVRRYVRRSGERYSIRRRSDGLFQVYQDNKYAGLGYGYDDECISGIFADVGAAEVELLRMRSDVEPEA